MLELLRFNLSITFYRLGDGRRPSRWCELGFTFCYVIRRHDQNIVNYCSMRRYPYEKLTTTLTRGERERGVLLYLY